MKKHFENIVNSLKSACLICYGDRLFSLAVFGSVAAGKMRPDSDIDLLIVARDLPRGRMARMREFEKVEAMLEKEIEQALDAGISTILSPVIKSPAEVELGSPLFLDMTDNVRILFDKNDYFSEYLKDLGKRLKEMGAKRVYKAGGYYWILKPDLKPGEEVVF